MPRKAPAPPPPSDPMTDLQNRWYNGVTRGLGLDPQTFQLSQPSPPLRPSDADLWAYQNVIPPLSLTFNRSLRGGESFFGEYAAFAVQMEHPESSFAQVIGEENYSAWSAYVKQQSPPPAENELPALFLNWATIHAPSAAAAGVNDLAGGLLGGGASRQALLRYQGPDGQPPDFAGTYDQLLQTCAQASGASLTFDSGSTGGRVGGTWAGGRNVGLDGLWAGSGGGARLSRRFAASRVTVSARFESYVVWTSTPGPWYDSSLLNAAYGSAASPPWPADANPTWDELFGPEGSMRRLIAALLVVDGVSARVTSEADYGAADRRTILDHAPKGVWPFYAPTDGGVAANAVSFDDSAGMQIETVIPRRNPLVIGANVLGVAQYLGHAVAGAVSPKT